MQCTDSALSGAVHEAHDTYHVGMSRVACQLLNEEVLLPLLSVSKQNYRYFVAVHAYEHVKNALDRAERITALSELLHGSVYRLLFSRLSRTFQMVGGARYFIAAARYASNELGRTYHAPAYHALARDMVLVAALAHILHPDTRRLMEDMELADQLPVLDTRARRPVEAYKARLIMHELDTGSFYVARAPGARFS